MPHRLEPKLGVLPPAQKEIWTSLAPAPQFNFVLYGGTAVALHLGHRESLDFDFFRSEPLDKDQIRAALGLSAVPLSCRKRRIRWCLAEMPAGTVKVSFFGGIGFGHVEDPLPTCDGILLVASLDDLMATKLKATLDRAEAKDYRDIAEMISAGVSLPVGVSAFRECSTASPHKSCARSAISGTEIWIRSRGPIRNFSGMHGIELENCRTWL